jgi:preprotein translocase subunit Sec61beta
MSSGQRRRGLYSNLAVAGLVVILAVASMVGHQ